MLPCGSRSLLSLPSAEGKRYRRYSGAPFFLNPQQRGYLRRYSGAAGGGDFTPSEGVCIAAARRRGQEGAKTPSGFLIPLLTPPHLPSDATPFGRASKSEGPTGRLVLQGHILDRSGAFRSRTLPLCTVWPRTVMRGSLRKVNSGHNSIPKSARRTELSPVSPVSPRDQRASRRKGGFGGSQDGAREPYGALAPFCLRRQTAAFPPVNTGPPGRRRRPMTTSSEGVKSPSALPRCIGGRFCVC